MIALGIAVSAVVIRFAPVNLPLPSRAIRIAPQCLPPTSEDYFFPAGSVVQVSEERDRISRAFLSRFLRAAGEQPLSCGSATDEAYRCMLVWDWGRPMIATLSRSTQGWTMRSTLFKDSESGRFQVDSQTTRVVSEENVGRLTAALTRTNFWGMDTLFSDFPESSSYEGPVWLVEGRSTPGHHVVIRNNDNDAHFMRFRDAARVFMTLAGLNAE
jgi:hypothetical protein